MAGEGGSSSTAATSVTMTRIEAVQTVMPAKVTDPRLSRKISVRDPLGCGIFGRRLHTVLYFKSVTKEDSGWLVAGWIRESLGRALVEQPLLGGRLRRVGDSEGEFEIVSNDSGVRLMEARTSMALSEFLELKDWEGVEADQLVFWKDIDGQNPQFYPLFYVQVTNFERGGYSIGISCSLLLADPLGMASFLKRWASIHNTLVSENDKSKLPIFYLLSLRRLNDAPSIHMISSNISRNRARAKIFNMAENMNSDEKICRTVASVCIEEAECHLGTKMASKYWLFLKKLSEDIKTEACSKEEIVPLSISGLSELSWDDSGVHEVAFFQGNRAIHVSFWIGSLINDGLVFIAPSSSDEGCSGMNVVVTTPEEEKIWESLPCLCFKYKMVWYLVFKSMFFQMLCNRMDIWVKYKNVFFRYL